MRRCSNASSLLRKDIVDMDLDKKLKIMENRNTLLEKENKKLKEELAQSGSLDKKYKELSDIRALKEQYTRLLDGMKKLKKFR